MTPSRREPPPSTAPGDDTEGPVSKSERKRQAHRLQSLGRALTELKPSDLDELDLPEKLRSALADYQRFPSHEARRRQLQFIGRLMRDVDPEPLQTALDTLRGQSAAAQYEFHQAESWRERLLQEPQALTEFLEAYPGSDGQQLRHRIQQVQKAKSEEQRKTAYRTLFRFVKDCVHPV